MSKTIFLLIWFALLTTSLKAQITRDLLQELLDLPGPPPRRVDPEARPESFFDDKTPPADDAPIEDLLIYWVKKAGDWVRPGDKRPTPTLTVATRLFEGVEAKPQHLTTLLNVLPQLPDVGERVKAIYEANLSTTEVTDDWREKVKEWLKLHSDAYLDELAADARLVRDDKRYSSILKADALETLALKSWNDALPLLEKLEKDPANPKAAVLAKQLFYEHAVREKDSATADRYREELKAIVENKTAPGAERDLAFDALTKNPTWNGFDEWYISLFSDDSLLYLKLDNVSTSSPLENLSRKNPDKWIPIISKLVGNRNRAVHNAAVQSLLQFERRKDALEPLLPWLTDDSWADARYSPGDRTTYVQLVSFVDLPASIPGLIWIVQNDDDELHHAARSLAKYKDPRAVPALLTALQRTNSATDRQDIIEALLACGAFDVATKVVALESFAAETVNPERRESIKNQLGWSYGDDDKLPTEIRLGGFLARFGDPASQLRSGDPDAQLVSAFVNRIDELSKTRPAVAARMSEIAANWSGNDAMSAQIRRIAGGRGDIDSIVAVLTRRKALIEKIPLELSWLTERSGPTRAIGIAVYEDSSMLSTLIAQSDNDTQIAALAAARLVRIPLPVDQIAKLLDSPDELLALAAERYLISEDSPAARDAVYAKHPNEFLILGSRDCFDVKTPDKSDGRLKELSQRFGCSTAFYHGDDYKDLDKLEDSLRREMKEDPNLLEIYAHDSKKLRVYRDRTVMNWTDGSGANFEYLLNDKDIAELRRRIVSYELETRPPASGDFGIAVGVGEFVTLDRRGGRRIFAYGGSGVFWWMSGFFWAFQNKDAKPMFEFQKTVAGSEIFALGDNLSPFAIWKNGGDFRLLVENETREWEIRDENSKAEDADKKTGEFDYKEVNKRDSQRQAERKYEHFEWRKIVDGKSGDVTDEPADFGYLRDKAKFPDLPEFDNAAEIDARIGDFEIRSGRDGNGLWRVNRDARIKIRDGNYSDPVITPDGKFVFATRKGSDSDKQNRIVRINLQTGAESVVKLPPAKEFEAVAYVAAHGRILVRTDAAPENRETPSKYFLLTAETGAVMEVKGEFQPFRRQKFRPLQPTGRANEVWATVVTDEATEVGVYDTLNFRFKPLLRLPGLNVDSERMFVDERERKVYLIHRNWSRGYLISVPLPAEPATKK